MSDRNGLKTATNTTIAGTEKKIKPIGESKNPDTLTCGHVVLTITQQSDETIIHALIRKDPIPIRTKGNHSGNGMAIESGENPLPT